MMPLCQDLKAGFKSYSALTKRILEGKKMRTWIKKIMAGLLLGSLVLSGLPALAQPQSPDIDNRIIHQQQRIQQGMNSGQLSPKEFKYLQKRLAHIQRLEAKMKSDGILTPDEHQELHRQLDDTGRALDLALQNKAYRPPPPPRY
jgi:hypothetical protein